MGGDGPLGEANATILSTTVTMISNLVGAGVVSLPYVLKRAGIVPGVIALVAMALLNSFSAMVIAYCCELTKKFNYKEVALASLGRSAGQWIGFTLVFYTIGSCIAFAAIIGDLVPDLVKAAIDASCGATEVPCADGSQGCIQNPCTGGAAVARDIFGRPEVMIVIVGSTFLYPLALQRNLDALKFTSALSFISIIYLFLMLCSLAGIGPRADPSTLNVGGNGDGIFVAFPILLVAMTFHYNVSSWPAPLPALPCSEGILSELYFLVSSRRFRRRMAS
jgi:amino acid permease